MVSSRARTPHPAARHVLVVVQNLPVPLDRRVWLECQALRAHGYDVSVICPKGPGDPRRQVIDGVHVYKYRPPPAARGLLGYALEFVYCWLRTALLSRVVWRRQPFHALQACNPPDTYWLLARMWQRRGRAVRLRPPRPQPRALPVPLRSADLAARALRAAVR